MERESKFRQEDVQRFAGGDYLTSQTSVEDGYWSVAEGVLLSLGAATRLRGKSLIGFANSAVLGFAQLGSSVIIQFENHVSMFGPTFFGITQDITDEDGNPIQTETDQTLTT